jgi:hypothetical protein
VGWSKRPIEEVSALREGPMESQVKQVLVVASKTANSERLMKEIEGRAAAGGCRFTLLIPDATDREKADRTLAWVLPLMKRAARAPVTGLVDGPDPFESVQRAVQEESFDEIIVSTLPRRVSQWLRRDLITRVETLGLPVKAVIPKAERDAPAAGVGEGGFGGGF